MASPTSSATDARVERRDEFAGMLLEGILGAIDLPMV